MLEMRRNLLQAPDLNNRRRCNCLEVEKIRLVTTMTQTKTSLRLRETILDRRTHAVRLRSLTLSLKRRLLRLLPLLLRSRHPACGNAGRLA